MSEGEVHADTGAVARRIVDSNMYMTLATADVTAGRGRGALARDAADVLPPAALRLYRASASTQFVLGPHDRRLPVKVES